MEETAQGQFQMPIDRYDGVRVNMEVRQKHLHSKKRRVKTWTPEEDQQLGKLYSLHPKKWAVIASLMTDRNENQCLHRYRRLSQLGAHRKIWSQEEDQAVRRLMKKVGKNWKLLSEMLGTKTGKQIRERFINKLDPKIKKEDWTDEQDRKIIELYSEIGRKWSEISKHLPGRPQNKIKNRFYSYIQKNYDIRYRLIQEKGKKDEKEDDREQSEMDEDEEFDEEEREERGEKEEKEEKDEKEKDMVKGLKQITAKVQNCGSMGDVSKDDKYFMYSFPSINQIDLEMKMQDFPEGQQNRCSRMLLGSLVKIEEQWIGKEKMDVFCPNQDAQNDLFYLSN